MLVTLFEAHVFDKCILVWTQFKKMPHPPTHIVVRFKQPNFHTRNRNINYATLFLFFGIRTKKKIS